MPDPFIPVTRDEVSDTALVPERLRFIARDLKALYELIERTVVPTLETIVKRLDALDREDGAINLRLNTLGDRVNVLEQEVVELRAMINSRA